jgi:Ca-activated chloride channel homolog
LPHASGDLKSRLLYNLGNATYRQGQLQKAVEHYEAALKNQPNDQQASENLAFVKKQLQQQQQQDKPQQGQNDDQPKEDRSGKEQQQDGMPEDQQQDGGQQESAPSPQSGSGKDQNEQVGPTDQQPQPAEAQNAQPQSQKQQQGRQPEAQMLNRLKDQPGRAMMPNYQKRTVDKDW